MRYCQYCGKPNQDDANFCQYCGTRLDGDSSVRKEVYQGIVYKCPNCGEPLNSFQSVCPSCGYEIRETKPSSAVMILAEQLRRVDEPEPEPKGFHPFRKKRDPNEIKQERLEKKEEIIRNFVIPTSKGELLEFYTYIMSKIEKKSDESEKKLVKVWISKLDEVYAKLLLVLSSASDQAMLQNIQQIYDHKKNMIKEMTKGEMNENLMFAIVFPLVILIFFGGMALLLYINK